MKQELSQLSNEIVSKIILSNDLSGLTKDQRVQYVAYRCKQSGLDVAGCPFNLIETNGKVFLYANKEAAAQLNQLRSLSPVVSKEEFLMDNTIFKVTYRVTENGRSTEDCGAVALVNIKRGVQGNPDEVRKMAPAEVADAIMKAHTKAKRRAILTHCGIGTNDLDEPLVVPDMTPQKEEIKQTEVTVKPSPAAEIVQKAEEKHSEKKANGYQPDAIGPVREEMQKNGNGTWRGRISNVRAEELPGGRPCWTVVTENGLEFRTADGAFEESLESLDFAGSYEIKYKPNTKGTFIIQEMRDAG